jgi:GNAT superfamily N-acetyltransferase
VDKILIRNYEQRDAPAIVRLFYDTIRSVNLKDYSEEQVRAWAPEVPDAEIWHSRMINRCTLLAEQDGEVVAFAELEFTGHLDMFYCRKDAVGRGVGLRLYRGVEAKDLQLGLQRIFAEVSITARHFFERCGFVIRQEQIVARRGVEMTNFEMYKDLLQRRTL